MRCFPAEHIDAGDDVDFTSDISRGNDRAFVDSPTVGVLGWNPHSDLERG
jgi:hypothetical protein